MGGFGSAQSMNTIMKNNRALIGKRKSMFSSKRDYIGSSHEKVEEEFVDYKTASPELLEEIRIKLINEKKASFRLSVLLFLLISIPAIGLTYHLFGNDKSIENKQLTEKSKTFQDSISKKFIFYIEDGDEWLNQGKIENALFQYNKALELDSNNFSTHYRICLAYSYLCRYDNLLCKEGKTHLEETLQKFPNESKLNDFKRFY
ncbi:MAG: tetratricopeptide repeat protein [Flavobacteriales bacterium]|nr:tetratricopeptide repeat protein [Flavobacteriales bacterium]